MLSCFFGFLAYPNISLVCSRFIMWSKSNPLVVFALDLKSTYEGEHTIFGLLGLANLTQNDVLQLNNLCASVFVDILFLITLGYSRVFWMCLSMCVHQITHTHTNRHTMYRCLEVYLEVEFLLFGEKTLLQSGCIVF
jgi:hypothetical protein